MLARLVPCVAAFFAVLFLHAQDAHAEARVALIIGNSNYGPGIGKLLNPANDAKLIAETLKRLGFSVDLLLDADQKAMKRAIKGFGTRLQDAGREATGFFYYAGHGVQVEGTNFLLPVGAEIEKESDVEIESISADDVMTQMQFAGNAVNLVFLDACRNNPLAKANRSATRGLARLDAPRGSFVGYSTAPGDVAADGDGANSPYALALAEELKNPGISVEEAHRNVRAKVLAASGNKQTPWDSSSLTGPVVLAAKTAEPAPQPIAAAPAAPPQATPDSSAEIVFWESIKNSTDPTEFDAYLQQYPQGSFAPLARAKIAKLTPGPTATQQSSAPPPAPATTPAPAAAPALAAAPAATEIAVSAEIKQEIEKYLRNASGSGRYFALAIKRDGSSVASLTCPKVAWDGKLGCDGWAPNQQHVDTGVVRKCGGSDTCILLYSGASKVANADIVVQ